MGILQTAERSSHLDPSENVIYQRHLIAYKEAAKLINGTVLEIGSGEGYGMLELAPKSEKYIAVDKYQTRIPNELKNKKNIIFIKSEVPPLKEVLDNSVDFVVTFQVIEHIKHDTLFLEEIHRVLKPGGKAIITTPNLLMSLAPSPWHIREYSSQNMYNLLASFFSDIELKGVFGNEKVMRYYQFNKDSVEKILRFDFLKMRYWMPKSILKIPYDILNRFNRHNLEDKNQEIVQNIKYTDYFIDTSSNKCLDHFCVVTK